MLLKNELSEESQKEDCLIVMIIALFKVLGFFCWVF